MGDFDHKVVFITGAARGQGRVAALTLAREGADIVAFDLGEPIPYPAYNRSSNEDLERLKDEIEALGRRCLICAGDVRDEEAVRSAVDHAIEAFGHIDVLFSNAGICAYGNSWELTPAEWEAMIGINLTGSWNVSRFIIPHMIEQKHGVIIYNSSIAGLRGCRRLAHYSASKHALVGLARSQAIELAPYNIRVLTLHPTDVNTDMNKGMAAQEGETPEAIANRSGGQLLPVPWIESEDVAEALRYVASDRARFVTGYPFVIDAGMLTK